MRADQNQQTYMVHNCQMTVTILYFQVVASQLTYAQLYRYYISIGNKLGDHMYMTAIDDEQSFGSYTTVKMVAHA